MNKEFTPLEALKEIREKTDAGFIYDYHNREPNPLKIIETALKALEIIANNIEEFSYFNIRANRNETRFIININSLDNKEEFDLLKEVLK